VTTLQSHYGKRDDCFLMVMALSFVLGMAVALAAYLLWKSHAGQLASWQTAMAMVICPPFVLTIAAGAAPDSDLMLVLVAGTIVFANAVLYSGVAAGIYFAATVRARRNRG
jgi:ABC-type Na+ efflux pump permease subunit